MLTQRYEFYALMARAISHSLAALTREILFLPLKHKIHIFSPPCNILYLTCELTCKIKQQRFNGQPGLELEGHNIIRLHISLAYLYQGLVQMASHWYEWRQQVDILNEEMKWTISSFPFCLFGKTILCGKPCTHLKMSFAYWLIFMMIKLVFI